MDVLTANLAYKYVALVLMLNGVNMFCGKTGIQIELPVRETDVRDGSHIGPPGLKDFSGSVLTDHYFFGFGRGHLANFYKRGFTPDSDQAIKARNLQFAKLSSQIDANGAYVLATNWLGVVGIDVANLERKYRRTVIQWRYYPEGKAANRPAESTGAAMMLPVYQVEWRGFLLRSQKNRYERAVVSMTIFGPTKELMEYHLLDDSLALNPRIQIKAREKLLALSDDEFRGLSALQRSNLVFQFAAPGENRSPDGAPASSGPLDEKRK